MGHVEVVVVTAVSAVVMVATLNIVIVIGWREALGRRRKIVSEVGWDTDIKEAGGGIPVALVLHLITTGPEASKWCICPTVAERVVQKLPFPIKVE
jgi:hypothetical protein